MKTTEDLLKEREKTHGAFADHARATQLFKNVITEELVKRRQRGQADISLTMHESLQMIAHKIGRILAGNSTEPDHWDDIAGYAKLISLELSKEKLPATQTLYGVPIEQWSTFTYSQAIPKTGKVQVVLFGPFTDIIYEGEFDSLEQAIKEALPVFAKGYWRPISENSSPR